MHWLDRRHTGSAGPRLTSAGTGVLSPEEAVAPAVVFDKVSFAFDDHVVLRDVSFNVPRGSMKILLGASGAGKSVVLRLILGLLRPDSGTILINGEQIDHWRSVS